LLSILRVAMFYTFINEKTPPPCEGWGFEIPR